MTLRENMLKAINFETPDYIPVNMFISPACWNAYPQEFLFEIMETHPILFPGFIRTKDPVIPELHPVCMASKPYTDDFGCVWETTVDGIMGTVVKHPLEAWENYSVYKKPDPEKCTGMGEIDWSLQRMNVQAAKNNGEFTLYGLKHGHTFLQLCDMRGYQNLMYDFSDDDARIYELISLVEEFNTYIVKQYTDMEVDMISYAEDLGMQTGPMISPEHFKKFIKPSYSRLMKLAKDKGIRIHMHSDGDIKTLADDLIDGGVEVINLQDLVNGIDWIAEKFSGKVCVDLDIDRQSITPRGTPKQIEALIKEEVIKIGSKSGGMMLTYGLYPNVPHSNIKALMDTLEKYICYYS